MTSANYWLVVPAAGIGQRMGAERPKQYLEIGARSILDITLSRLLDHAPFAGCMVALHARDRWWPDCHSARDARIQTCTGGGERAESVLSALRALAGQAAASDWVLVHDAARPCVHREDLRRLMDTLADHPVGGLLAAPVADTLKQAAVTDHLPEVEVTVDRSRLWRALTPQMFRIGALTRALEDHLAAGRAMTDEASAMELSGYRPVLVEGRPDNIKITVPSDLALAEFILGRL